MPEEKIAHCPFCRSTNVRVKVGNLVDAPIFFVSCHTCGADGPISRRDYLAIAEWNRCSGYCDVARKMS